MENEVLQFAKEIGATDLKNIFDFTEFHGLFKRRNYFLLNKNIFLIIKISRGQNRPFWGLGKQFFDLYNTFTEKSGNYYFVALESNKSGWVLSKMEILRYISNGSLSYSESQKQYKINIYNFRHHNSFASIDDFLIKIGNSS
jgi:hypothetical protein